MIVARQDGIIMKSVDPKIVIYKLVPRINIALIVCVFVLGGYLLFLVTSPYKISVQHKRNSNVLWKKDTASKLPVFDASVLRQRPLFGAGGKKSSAHENKVMVLLGVAMGDKKSAMIRDVKANKDYYCSEGDMVGDYRVKEIQKDKVIIEYEGSVIEIAR